MQQLSNGGLIKQRGNDLGTTVYPRAKEKEKGLTKGLLVYIRGFDVS